MLKVFLVLGAFYNGQWVPLTDEAIPMPSIEECIANAKSFMDAAQSQLDDEISAASAECRMGKVAPEGNPA